MGSQGRRDLRQWGGSSLWSRGEREVSIPYSLGHSRGEAYGCEIVLSKGLGMKYGYAERCGDAAFAEDHVDRAIWSLHAQ